MELMDKTIEKMSFIMMKRGSISSKQPAVSRHLLLCGSLESGAA